MRVPIRLRLTLLYFFFFALAGILLGLASWLLLERSLDALMLHELDERGDDIQEFLASRPTNADIDSLRSDVRNEYRLKDEGKWLQITDGRDRWIYFSNRGAIADPVPAIPTTPGRLIPFVATAGHRLRALNRELKVNGQNYHVSMALSADRSFAILKQFKWDLWLLGPIVLISAAGVGHFLSRKALDPVRSIVAEVRRINERNLSARLSVAKPRDELSLLSQTLNEMLERIDTAFRSVRVLTANASHELRTPLSLIRTRLEIALCFPRTPDYYKEAFEEVLTETLRMTSLIENLLTLARSDAGAAQPELSPVELSELLKKAAREWAGTAERLSLDLQFQPAEEPLWVLADSDLIERIIRTLMDNASRYTPSGGWMRLEGKVSGKSVIIAVQDNGVGIAPEDQPRIFERFFRSQPPQHQEQRGSGLGLSLARWIAEQHRASLTVASEVGVGSRFEVIFPPYPPT